MSGQEHQAKKDCECPALWWMPTGSWEDHRQGQKAGGSGTGRRPATWGRHAGLLTCAVGAVPCALGAALGWCAHCRRLQGPELCACGPRVCFALSPAESDTGPALVRRIQALYLPPTSSGHGSSELPLCACAPDSLLLCPGSQGVMPAEQTQG